MKDIELILQDQDASRLMLQAFQSILNDTDMMVFVKDANLVYRAANMPFVRMVNKACLDDVIGYSDFEIFEDPILAQRYVSDDRKIIEGNTDIISFTEPITEDNGRPRFAKTSKYILRDSNRKIIGIAGISRDVTQEIVATQDHQKGIAYLFELPESVFMAVYIDVTEWRIIGERQHDVDALSFRMHENADVLKEKACKNVVDPNGPAYLFYKEFSSKFLQEIYNSGRRNFVMEYLRRFQNTEERWVRDELSLMVDPSNNHLCMMLTVADIHSQKKEEVELLRAAERDELTGILNRASVVKYTKALLNNDSTAATHAMFVIDIDNFKRINDTFGHQAGDQFLISIAQTIRKCFRDSDLVARIGGDEFVILMKHVPGIEIIKKKGQALLTAIKEACLDMAELNVSASIGVSIYPDDGRTFDQLFEKADQAMYAEKRNGKASLLIYSDLPEKRDV